MSRDFTVIGRALAAPARATIIDLLMDGSARPAGELATAAGISASATSEHLTVLLDAGLIHRDARGRQRFYRVASPSVAAGLEHIGQLCPATPVRSLRQSRQQRDLADARLCYDHLAGRIGVALTDTYVERGWLQPNDLSLTPSGERAFTDLGIDLPGLLSRRRRLTRPCPDWTERRLHLAGSLGAAIADLFRQRDWTQRRPTGRGLTFTSHGAHALRTKLDVHP